MTLVLDESGREIKLSGDNAVIHDAKDATWLKDNATIVYLNEAVKPNLLFSFKYANIRTGPAVQRSRAVPSSRQLPFHIQIRQSPSNATATFPVLRVFNVWNFSRKTTKNSPRLMDMKLVYRFHLQENMSLISSIRKYWRYAISNIRTAWREFGSGLERFNGRATNPTS